VPAALPWYYTWPLAVIAALAQSPRAIAVIAGLSTWITVIWKPDGAHGMYSWIHVLLATACGAVAWYSLYRAPEPNTPSPGPDAPPHGPDASEAHQPAGH
jgi:alpha-1,6-mannosyltransferase